MQCSPGDGLRINSFALVSYIPDPLGAFLDRLRSELVPGCTARSHVTVLPPRALEASPEAALSFLHRELQDRPPFPLELTQVQVFEETSVIYVGIGAGAKPLLELNRSLNRDGLAFPAPYPFHPHVTLAQNLPPGSLEATLALARKRWAGFQGRLRFEIEALTFVQNTLENQWLDIERISLVTTASPRVTI